MDKRKPMLWDIFCKVIDNYGDIGVCWRLSADLAARGEQVRLWVDDTAPLQWLAPQGCEGVEVCAWTGPASATDPCDIVPGDVVIEAFGCELDDAYKAALADKSARSGAVPWLNLEYLTAERYAARAHALPSPVMSGPAAGLTKHFFYPGFTPDTGGLLREHGLMERRAAFDRQAWLHGQSIEFNGERLVSLFCYEPTALAQLLDQLAEGPQATRLLVTPGRASNAVRAIAGGRGNRGTLALTWLQPLPQTGFDHLLWACDFNFVRGEDSLVRALWAGAPFAWQAYPQDDGAHHAKLQAFLDMMQAPGSLRHFHEAWNSADAADLPALDLPAWGQAAVQARQRLLEQDGLATQLLKFVQKKR